LPLRGRFTRRSWRRACTAIRSPKSLPSREDARVTSDATETAGARMESPASALAPMFKEDSRSQIPRYHSLAGRLAPPSEIYTFTPPGYETNRTSHLIFTFRRFSSHLAIYRKRVDKISCALCFWRLRSQGQIRRLRACKTPEALFRNRRRARR